MRSLILVAGCSLALAACAAPPPSGLPAAPTKIESTVNVLCQSAPLAQVALNVAMQNHDPVTVNQIFDVIRLSCPTVLGILHVYDKPVPPAPPPPSPGPERG